MTTMPKRSPARQVWAISDGREAVGSIEFRSDGQYAVVLPDHSIIGRYPTFQRAVAALNRQRPQRSSDGDG
jgi:hypothetical protein